MIEFQDFDERRRYVIPGNHERTVQFATIHWIEAAQTSIEAHGAFYVALSGGSTPKEIFRNLASPKFRKMVDWQKVHLFWSDERSVPPTDDESNYKMAMEAGFNQLPIPPSQIHRMPGDDKPTHAAIAYETLVMQKLQGRPFDLIMLGMGSDGHTASLFPGSPALKEQERLVVVNPVIQKQTWRITMTYPLINSALQAVIYVLGATKQSMVSTIFSKQPRSEVYPVEKVGTSVHPALWIMDRDASSKLTRE